MMPEPKLKLSPRNDYVVIRVRDVGESAGGVAIPEVSIEGKEFFVEAKGPDVTGLEVGNKVLCIGTKGEDYSYLPNQKALFIIKQSNVILIFGEEAQPGGRPGRFPPGSTV